MINHRIRFVLLFICSLLFNEVQAQKQTVYEKKTLEIKKKYVKKMLIDQGSWSQRSEFELNYSNEDYLNTVLILGAIAHPIYTEALIKELKLAEKLKTEIDFKREKEKRDKEALLYGQKPNSIKNELPQSTDEYKNNYVLSVKEQLKERIRLDFDNWTRKGEFEKEIDFYNRLESQSKVEFDKICIEKIKSEFTNIKSELEVKLLNYDSENEFFIIQINLQDFARMEKLYISIDNAELFKDNWDSFSLLIHDEAEWCFIENKLIPTSILLINNELGVGPIEIQLNLKSSNPLEFNYFDLGINNPNPKLLDLKFNYSKFLENEKEVELFKLKLDSLELVGYNNLLDSVYYFYNAELLENPYNVNQVSLEVSYNIDKNSDRELSYNKEVLLIENRFKETVNQIEGDLLIKNPNEFVKLFYSINPDKELVADSLYLDCKCHYLKRSEFDLKFIKNEVIINDCRENKFKEVGVYFSNKEEFNRFYDFGDEILTDEVKVREFKSYKSEIAELSFKNVNKLRTREKEIKDEKLFALSKEIVSSITNKEDLAKYFVNIIESFKENFGYQAIVDFTIENNKELSKEFKKNGVKFLNKIDFFEAYLSGDYKKRLAEIKK